MFPINQLFKTVSRFTFQGNFVNLAGLSAPCFFHNLPIYPPLHPSTWNSSLLQPTHSPLKNLARKQKREKIQYRKWTIGAVKMRSSIFYVRDDLSIFYIVFFLFSSVLATPFQWASRLPAQTRISYNNTLFLWYLPMPTLLVRTARFQLPPER